MSITSIRFLRNTHQQSRYHLVDYALAKACEMVKKLKIVFTYDVACRHDKNARSRFQMWLPNNQWILDLLKELVPKMHILAHKVDCQFNYALDYEDGVGMTHGETVEQPWAEGNQTGSSTQEMNPGHRLDALDDFHSFWCWSKVQNLRKIEILLLFERFSFLDSSRFFEPAISRRTGCAIQGYY